MQGQRAGGLRCKPPVHLQSGAFQDGLQYLDDSGDRRAITHHARLVQKSLGGYGGVPSVDQHRTTVGNARAGVVNFEKKGPRIRADQR